MTSTKYEVSDIPDTVEFPISIEYVLDGGEWTIKKSQIIAESARQINEFSNAQFQKIVGMITDNPGDLLRFSSEVVFDPRLSEGRCVAIEDVINREYRAYEVYCNEITLLKVIAPNIDTAKSTAIDYFNSNLEHDRLQQWAECNMPIRDLGVDGPSDMAMLGIQDKMSIVEAETEYV